MFANNEQCIEYLSMIRFEDWYKCPKCKHDKYWLNNRQLMICKKCRYNLSVTAWTIFHRSKIDLTILFRTLWYIVAQKHWTSAVWVQNILWLRSYLTAWTWLHKFRRLMITPWRKKLSWVVEVDETLVWGKKPWKRWRWAAWKILVIIAIEINDWHPWRARLWVIPDASATEINKFIKANIEKWSEVVTDWWKSYNSLTKMWYSRTISDNLKLLDDEWILPNAHQIAALLKRWLLWIHQNYVSHEQLEFYLDEYVFKYNRRKSKSRGLLFKTLIENAMKHEHVSYNEIARKDDKLKEN